MFCDSCGTEAQANQRFCSVCGKAAGPVVGAPRSRVSRHLHLLGILWLVYAAFALLASCIMGVLAITLFGVGSRLRDMADFPRGAIFMHSLFVLLGTFVFIKALAALAAGFGLMNRQSWARSLAIIIAFLAMLSIPFGTALGIYTLWVLMNPTADEEYRRLTTTA